MSTFVVQNQQQTGPFDDEVIREGIRSGQYSPDQLAWKEGMAEWVPLRTLFPDQRSSGGATTPPPLPVRLDAGSAAPLGRLGDSTGIRWLLPVGRSGWAIAAGYLGLISLLVIPAPLALIISGIAIWDIRRSRTRGAPIYGMGRAVFGLIAGALGTAALIAFLLRFA